jgi:hypothetical protein
MDAAGHGSQDGARGAEPADRTPARIDFTEWSRLAREAPLEFEQRRRETLEAAIARARPALQNRLRGLQSRIDLERRRARNPLAATIRLHAMMWAEFERLRAALNQMPDGPCRSVPAQTGPARVIPLRPRG